ncbi:inositol polyphosphate multikinase isoform X2 [Genypterus blacodes]|uniref:inositol polyphosphate multikinase isoform X2 n=1 Tax=Genypterus blacodes TaxID=154954 RepID=UPI003F7766EA
MEWIKWVFCSTQMEQCSSSFSRHQEVHEKCSFTAWCMQTTAVIHVFWSSRPICPSTMAPGPLLILPMLEDVTRRFVKPCIMDVKLGQRSYDPFASQEKREQQIRKYPLMEEIGFLVLGMRVFKVCSDTFEAYDQHYGRGLVKDTIKDGLAKFFHSGVCLRKDAVLASIGRVRRILCWFESQRQLTFYASSLLFVYEGLPSSSSPSLPSLSSLLAAPLISPTTGKTALLPLADDTSGGGERKGGQGAGQEDELAEYNNNIRVAVPWEYSMDTLYSNHRKSSHHHCTKGHLHSNSGTGVTVAAVISGGDISALSEEDNSAWKRTGETGRQHSANGNGNKSQLEGGGEGRESANKRRGEDREGRGREETGGGRGEGEVEVKMIDFAHVFPSESHDQGYIYGLKRLLTVLEQILHEVT